MTGVTALVIGAVILIFLPVVSEKAQVYTDVIVEFLAIQNLNKSGEIELFWRCALGGGILMLLLDRLYASIGGRRRARNAAAAHPFWKGAALLVLPNLAAFVYFGRVRVFLIFLCVEYFLLCKARPRFAFKGVALSLCTYYSLLALAAAINLTPVRLKITEARLDTASMIIAGALCCAAAAGNRERLMDALTLGFQLPVPALLLVFLVNRYFYRGEIQTVPFPIMYQGLILALTAALILFAARKSIRLLLRGVPLSSRQIVLLSTVLSIFVFHSYSSPGRFFPTDWHHTGERMIPWQQVFEQGQTLYDRYLPASGLFPMVVGFIQNVVLDGTVTSYPAAITLMTIFFSAVTIVLCYFVGGGEISLFIAVFTGIPGYDRPYMILPSLLLLMLPWLVRRRHLWLPCWIFLCFLGGLYYPVYGGAVLLASLPFGLVQLWRFIHDKEYRPLLKKPSFYIIWGLVLLPILYCTPLLLRMARHILSYASQTVCADGIAVYGSPPPDSFFRTVSGDQTRLALYYAVRIGVPILSLLAFVYLLYLYVACGGSSLRSKLRSPAFLGFFAGIGSLLVSYTYTQVRMESQALLSRSGPVVILLGGILLAVVVWKYGGRILSRGTRHCLTGAALGLAVIFSGLGSDIGRVFYCYGVGEERERIEAQVLDPVPRAGPGYIAAQSRERLVAFAETFSDPVLREYPILNLPDQLAYYALNLRASATGTTFIAKSGKTQQQILEILEKEKPLISAPPLSSFFYSYFSLSNYHIYRWMMDGGYVLGPDGLYIPPELMDRYAGGDYQSDRRTYRMMQQNLGNISSSLGRTMNRLRHLFSPGLVETFPVGENDIAWRESVPFVAQRDAADPYFLYQFARPVDGREADFLYLELDASVDTGRDPEESWVQRLYQNTAGEQYQIRVYWGSEEEELSESLCLSCHYGDGRLLIPLGSHPGWLLSRNTMIRIDFEGFQPGTRVAVKRMEFLKMDLEEAGN